MRFLKGFLTNLLLFSVLNYYAQEITHEHSIYHSFLENKGQWDDHVLFKLKFHGGNLWVEQKRLLFHVQDFRAVQQAHTAMMDPDENEEGNRDNYKAQGPHRFYECW